MPLDLACIILGFEQVRLLQDWNLKLDGLDLEAIPGALWEKGSKVKELILSRNSITSLPPEISLLSSLRTLKLDCNALTHLPAEVGSLSELQVLDLASNSLEAVPLELGTCCMLKVCLGAAAAACHTLPAVRKCNMLG